MVCMCFSFSQITMRVNIDLHAYLASLFLFYRPYRYSELLVESELDGIIYSYELLYKKLVDDRRRC